MPTYNAIAMFSLRTIDELRMGLVQTRCDGTNPLVVHAALVTLQSGNDAQKSDKNTKTNSDIISSHSFSVKKKLSFNWKKLLLSKLRKSPRKSGQVDKSFT